MNKLLETMFAKTPQCFSKFNTARTNIPLPNQQHAGPEFVTQSISCICGNEHLYLEAARRKELKGVCRKDEIITLIPPVYVGCPKCKSFTLLFDPLIHGWKGMVNEGADSDDVLRLMKCTPNPGRVYVNYAYRNFEKYQQLLASGISNPEDYFDAFTVLFGDSAGANIKEILSCECV
jgi:hypothetical protein